MLNAFTVDVEDYFQVSAFERNIPRSAWGDYPHHVQGSTSRLLELLAKHDVKGTFFVLGWTAEQYPGLVRDIADAGHELASHSYWHRLVYELTPDEFREDLRRSRDAIESACGQRVTAYRAPSFSITEKSFWALEVLREEGFTVDSSIFPIVHDRYGVPGAKPEIHTLETPAGAITEFPPAVSRVGGINLPMSGGGYFRLYPFLLTRKCLTRINQASQPFMFYIHPWEIDTQQMRMSFASASTRFRHYVNLRSTYRKLDKLLTHFEFGRMCDVLQQQGFDTAPEAALAGQA